MINPIHKYKNNFLSINSIGNKIYDFAIVHPVYSSAIISILISIVVYWSYMVTGTSYFYSSMDGYTHTWAYTKNLANYIRSEGIPMWSFSIGMGSAFTLDWFGNLFYGVSILLGEELLPFLMTYMQIAKIVLAAIFFCLFLKKLDMHPLACIMGSICYSFSGIMIIRGPWAKYATEGFLLALLLYATEKYFKDNNWAYIPLALFLLSLSCGAYYVYLYTIILLIYSTLRYLYSNKFQLKAYMLYLTKNAVVFAIGVLSSAVILIPYVYSMLSSERFEISADKEISFFGSLLGQTKLYLTEFFRFFSSDVLGGSQDYTGIFNSLEGPLFYCGLLAVLLLPQAFYLCSHKTKKMLAFSLGLAAVYIISPMAVYLFNAGISGSFKLSSLWIVTLIIVVCSFVFSEMCKGKKLSYKLLFLTFSFLVLFFLGLSFLLPQFEMKANNSVVFLVAVFTLIYWCIFLLWKNIFKKRRFTGLILAAALLETTFFSNISSTEIFNSAQAAYNYQKKAEVGIYDYSNNAVKKIKKEDKDFYRISEDEKFFDTDPLFQEYFGTSYYDSFSNKAYQEFISVMNLNSSSRPNYSYFSGIKNRPFLESLMSVKYNIGNEESKAPYGFTLIDEIGDRKIYKNGNALPLGFTYDQYILRSDFIKLNDEQKDIALLHAFVVEEPVEGLREYLSAASGNGLNYKIQSVKIESKNSLYSNEKILKNNFPQKLTLASKSEDPIVIIPISLPTSSNYMVSFNVFSKENDSAKIFWSDATQAFTEENSKTYEYKANGSSVSFMLEGVNFETLRIDPGTGAGKYTITNFKIEDLGSVSIQNAIVKEEKRDKINLGNVEMAQAVFNEKVYDGAFSVIAVNKENPQIIIPMGKSSTADVQVSFNIGQELDNSFFGSVKVSYSEDGKTYLTQNERVINYSSEENKVNVTFYDAKPKEIKIDFGCDSNQYNIFNLNVQRLSGNLKDKTYYDLNEIVPENDVSINQKALNFLNLESNNIDPILLAPINASEPADYTISFFLENQSLLPGSWYDTAQIFWDETNQGLFSEEDSQVKVYGFGSNYVEFQLKNTQLKTLRIDPGTQKGNYVLSDLLIVKSNAYKEYAQINQRKKEAFEIERFRQNNIAGTITSQESKMLFFSIPYDNGWRVFVDDQPTKIQKVNIGFIGIPILEGTHRVELRYITPGLIPGAIISLLFIALYVVLLFLKKKISFLN